LVELDIVIPVYNEGGNIISVMESFRTHVKTPYRVLICYDIDEDDTLTALSNYSSDRADIVYVKNSHSGPNMAVVAGLKASKAPYILVYMADDDYNADLIDQMVQKMKNGFDIVSSSRWIKGGCYDGAPFIKHVLTRTASYTAFLIGGLKIHDATQAFRLFSRRVIDNIEITSTKGLSFTFELLAKVNRLGWPVCEIPAPWYERKIGNSRFQYIKWIWPYFEWWLYSVSTVWLRRGPKSVKLRDESINTTVQSKEKQIQNEK
jgi:dolichol-phosphate mannosyltransferase